MSPDDPHRPHVATPAELKAMNEMRRSGRAFLAWRDDAGALQLWALDPAAPRTTIGRSPASTIALRWDSSSSALHAEITRIDEQWLIADDGLSTNGTYVAGRRIHGRTRVRDEDRIVIGSTALVFHSAKSAAVRTTLAGLVVTRNDLSDIEFRVLRALCRPIVLGSSRAPATNYVVKDEVFLTLDGVKRCLTRLYATFAIPADSKSKRLDLVHAAISCGVIGRHCYS
jgi:hypothetical protein